MRTFERAHKYRQNYFEAAKVINMRKHGTVAPRPRRAAYGLIWGSAGVCK